MSKSVQVEVDTKKLNEILKKLPGNRDKAIRAIAFSIERKAKFNIQTQKLVDTGALINSVYTRTSNGNYSGGTSIADLPPLPSGADPNTVRETLPTAKEGEAVIGPSVEYGITHELGLHGNRARAFLGPAVNSTFKELQDHLKGVCTDDMK